MFNRLVCSVLAGAVAAPAVAIPPARTRLVASGLAAPLGVTYAPGDATRIYVSGKLGMVWPVTSATATVGSPFLDLTAQVNSTGDGGLLGFTFDPLYQSNSFFYVLYIEAGTGDEVISRFFAPPGTTTVNPLSGTTIWRFPRQNGHFGGWIGFHPLNGLMYITSGDGDLGGTYDAGNHGQTIVNERLAKIFRIDVRTDDFPADPGRNYHIPPTNPFVGATGDDEIWSYGVRNPWRASFDRATGDFYFGDVGQDTWEEIDREPAASTGGRNYGWRCMEADTCTNLDLCTCNTPNFTPPIHAYDHATTGLSVIGGYVYRGSAIPSFQGLYIFGDFAFGRIWSCQPGATSITALTERTADFAPAGGAPPIEYIGAFGEDSAGELYVCDVFKGRVYQVVPYPCAPAIDTSPANQVYGPGQTITMSATAAGQGPLTFAWRKGGAALVNGGRVSGANTATLTITNAQAGDTAAYDVVVSGPCGGPATSPAAQITVNTNCRKGDFNGNGTFTSQDIFAFLAAWFAHDPSADVNLSGAVTLQDVFDFLNAWYLRCV